MSFDLSWDTIFLFAAALAFAGVIAGLIAGLLGVGGGIVIVPVLFHVFTALGIDESVRMHLAVGTSLATIIPTSLRSALSHHKKGAVDVGVFRSWAAPILAGVVAGAIAARFIGGEGLTLVFAVLALIAAANLAFGREEWRLGNEPPKGLLRIAISSAIGFFSTLMGIGGGTFSVPVLSMFGVPIHRAVGTAAAIGFLIAVPGALGFVFAGWGVPLRPPFSLGYVNLLGMILIVPTTVLAAPFGVTMAHRLNRVVLTRIFALFLAVTSLRMFYELFG